jgi:hypothetical protein
MSVSRSEFGVCPFRRIVQGANLTLRWYQSAIIWNEVPGKASKTFRFPPTIGKMLPKICCEIELDRK